MNNKGQLGGIVFFVFLVIGIILLAPIVLRMVVSILDKTSTSFASISGGNKSSETIHAMEYSFVGAFDWMIILLIAVDCLVLFISAFLIDIHPAFLIIYIIGCFVLVLTAPYSIAAAEKIYLMEQFAGSDNIIQYIPMTEFIMNNFGIFIVCIIIVTGVLMYAKLRFNSQGAGGVNY